MAYGSPRSERQNLPQARLARRTDLLHQKWKATHTPKGLYTVLYITSEKKTRWLVTDIVDQQTRSRMMAGIKGKNTKPELVLRKALHARGLRFRLHVKNMPGRPDLLFPKYQAVLFVNGCFWHRHGCRYTTTPSSRVDFWEKKFSGNVARDLAIAKKLADAGWRIGVVWECALKHSVGVAAAADEIHHWLVSDVPNISIG